MYVSSESGWGQIYQDVLPGGAKLNYNLLKPWIELVFRGAIFRYETISQALANAAIDCAMHTLRSDLSKTAEVVYVSNDSPQGLVKVSFLGKTVGYVGFRNALENAKLDCWNEEARYEG